MKFLLQVTFTGKLIEQCNLFFDSFVRNNIKARWLKVMLTGLLLVSFSFYSKAQCPPVNPVATVINTTSCSPANGVINFISPSSSTNVFSIDGGATYGLFSQTLFLNLPAGTYQLRAKNISQNCESAIVTVTITGPAVTTPVLTTTASTSCTAPNGSITVTTPSSATHTFSVDGGVTYGAAGQSVFTGLAPGSYNVIAKNTVTGCTSSAAVAAIAAPAAIANPTGTATVSGCTVLSGTVTITGPTPLANYQFSINGGGSYSSSNVFTGLVAGTYTMKVRSIASGCTSANVSIVVGTAANPAAPAATTTQTYCSGDSGTITFTSPAPAANFQYSIDNGITYGTAGQTVFNNLPAGSYNLRARSVLTGCVSSSTVVTITLASNPANPTATTAASNCSPVTGKITFTGPTPVSNYQYSTDGGVTYGSAGQVLFSNLAPGTYTIRAKSAITGCVSNTATVTIAKAANPAAPAATITSTGCAANTGIITFTAPAPVANYQYSIDGGANFGTTGQTVFNGLAAGAYQLVSKLVSTGCISTVTNVTVGVTANPAVPASTAVASGCSPASGKVTFTGPTPTANFQYSIDGGTTYGTTGQVLFTNLAPGVYTTRARSTITGCVSNTGTVTVGVVANPAVPAATVTASNCTPVTGRINFTGPTPTANFQYSIDGGTTYGNAGEVSFTSLAPGAYSVRARSTITGCVSNAGTITVGVVANPAAPAATVTPTNCNGNTGIITITAPTPAANYQYSIDGGTTFGTAGQVVFNNLAAGAYQLVAKLISTGCNSAITNVTIAVIANPAAPAATTTAATNCLSANGAITFTGPTPTANFQYSIDGGATYGSTGQTVFSGLSSGPYTVKARSVITGCVSANATITVNSTAAAPAAPTATQTASTSCAPGNGKITFTGPAPTANYQYSIDGGTTYGTAGQVLFSNLLPGVYTLRAKSITSGCVSNTATITVGQPAVPATPVVAGIVSSNCSSNTGAVTFTAPAPVANFQYSIDNGVTYAAAGVTLFNGLAPGVYSTRARSVLTGCVSNAGTFTINLAANPANPTATVTASNCSPVTGTITFTGPTPVASYEYSIDGGATYGTAGQVLFSNLAPGAYSIRARSTITGCISNTATVTITKVANPAAPAATVTPTNCNGNTGIITVTSPTPVANYQYSVDGGTTFGTTGQTAFSGLAAGVYPVVAKLVSTGCVSAATNITVGVAANPANPTATVTASNCSPVTGTITFTGPTPVANFEYSIDGGATYGTAGQVLFSNLAPGAYSIRARSTITGCISNTATVTITKVANPAVPAATVTPTNCNGNTGIITVTSPTPVANYQYSVDGGTTFGTTGQTAFSGLAAGVYPVVAKLVSTGCISAATNITVGVAANPANPTATVTASNCSPVTGTITFTGPTPVANFEYSIDGGATYGTAGQVLFSNLAPGAYSIRARSTITGCISNTATVTITKVANPAAPAATVTPTNCNGNTGIITVTSPTPVANYQYSVDGGTTFGTSGQTAFSGLAAGIYPVVAKLVSTGCISTATNITVGVAANPANPTATTTASNCLPVTGTITFTGPTPVANFQYSTDGGTTFGTTGQVLFTNLAAGTYTIMARSALTGCISNTATVTIAKVANPAAPAATVTPTNCNGNTGIITVTSPTPVANYQYSVDGGTTFGTTGQTAFSGLAAGVYPVVAKLVSTGCISAATNITVGVAANPPAATATTVPSSCLTPNGQINFTGPTPTSNYQYSIDGGATFGAAGVTNFSGIGTGTYTINARSVITGCVSPAATVTVNPIINIDAGLDQALCAGQTLYMNAVAITGGNWVQDPGNPSVATFSSLTDSRARVRGLLKTGTYRFSWGTLGQCYDQMVVTVNSCTSPLPCDDKAYLTQAVETSPNSGVYQFNMSKMDLTSGVITPWINSYSGSDEVNPMGYNVLDNHLWVIDNTTSQVMRIGANGVPVRFDIPNFPSRPQYPADWANGTIGPNGVMYFSSNSGSSTIYRMDLNPNSPTYLGMLSPLTINPRFTGIDIHYNINDNKIYSVANNGRLYKIDPTTGATSDYGYIAGFQSNDPQAFGAQYMDADGNFYFVSNTSGLVYRIEQVQSVTANNARAVVFSNTIQTYSTDGAICLYACIKVPVGGTKVTFLGSPVQIDAIATANYRWSAAGGNPGPSTIVSPASSISLVRGFSTPGTYKYIWTKGFCSDTIDVIVVKATPDVNDGLINTSISGSVNTNDIMPSGTTYGQPSAPASSPAGSTPVLTMNTDGSYTFTTNVPGVYTYQVPVCVPGGTAPCPTVPLVITVRNPAVKINPPVANTDIASTPINTAVNINIKANDGPGNTGGALGNPAIVTAPSHGTATVNGNGTITYTPATGYTGADTLYYRICENPGGLCTTASVIINVLPAGAVNTTVAADDYVRTKGTIPATGNVRTNDSDPEGDRQTVTAQNITLPGKGTFVLSNNGNYTFTPAAGFTGTVDIPYTTCDNGNPSACAAATLHVVVDPPTVILTPDLNDGLINTAISGNVNTNDNVPTGTTYGQPSAPVSAPAGSTPVFTMNTDGSYTFTTNVPGVYTYLVPVCTPGGVIPCPAVPLVITVRNPYSTNNLPVANTDVATTPVNTAVTIPVLANDGPGNTGGVLGTPMISAAPLHGTAIINADGTLTYTPAANYTGIDTVRYQVCETPGGLCTTAAAVIKVQPAGAENTTVAADDYIRTTGTAPAAGNVKTNDSDPEGDVQTVTAQNTTIPNKGSFVLNTNGTYTFTPVQGFAGTVDIPYTTCDNGVPSACASATLHVVVDPLVILNPDINAGIINIPVPGNVNTNDNVPAGTTYGQPSGPVSSPAGSTPVLVMNPDGTYTFTANVPGVYTYQVPVCIAGKPLPCSTVPLVITVTDPSLSNNPPVANTDITSTPVNTPVTIPVLANDGPGNTGGTLGTPTISTPPSHGTAVVNPDGTITYTPTPGYTGTDTLRYQVCEHPPVANTNCTTAQVVVTTQPAGAANSTVAVDDYVNTTGTTPAAGNVKTNDSDPQGNTQTVATQNLTFPNKGTFVLNSDGSYIFTPAAGFTGTVDIPYTTCDNGTPSACASATLHVVVDPVTVTITPDVNVGIINTPIPGNVHTNDNVPSGTTYGTPVPSPGNPAGGTITMNPDGSYVFTATTPGVYTYNVPVCVPGGAIPCPTVPLVITVRDPNAIVNAPVANTDLATTSVNTPVKVNVKANDAPGNTGGTLGAPAIATAPSHGTAVVNPDGTIAYTPAPGYTGTDTLRYQVCEYPAALCTTAAVVITVQPAGAVNTTVAVDDYVSTTGTIPATGNVKTNDSDPQGNTQTVATQNLTFPNKGTFVLNADGTYVFTPAAGFTGTVDIPYTTCDNGTPSACASATLHVVVDPVTITITPDVNVGIINTPIPGNVHTNDNVPAGTTYGTPVPSTGNPAGGTITMNPDGSYVFTATTPGVYTYQVPVCVPGGAIPCPTVPLVITVTDPSLNNNPPVANTDITATPVNTPVTIPVLANDGPGNTGGTLGTPTISTPPSHGTAVVNPDGTITYTPTPGYTGTDTLRYQVCEHPPVANTNCTTAQVVVTTQPAGAANSTVAVDDYVSTTGTTPATGNVKTNDSDPQGNTQTVATQNLTFPNKGTFVLNSDGSYIFTPAASFTGTVDIPYTTCDNGTPSACASATLHVVVDPVNVTITPDVNVGIINTPIPGNVHTNDNVPAGTTYGTPVPSTGNPSGGTITMNPDGSYVFTATTPGVYTYNVPVCVPGGAIPCPTVPLVITVTDPALSNNPPVANTDIAVTPAGTPVTVPVLANDGPGNTGGTLGTPTITTPPSHGTAVVNPDGTITYTPTPGYTGTDTLLYQVCEHPPVANTNCSTAEVVVTTLPAAAVNTTAAADDYISTTGTAAATGNVSINDTDPEGDIQTVSPQTLTLPGQGVFVLNADGSYSFTAVPGFAGTVNIPYTTCDNGTPSACASATLHVVVKAADVKLNPDANAGIVNIPVSGNVNTNDNVPAGTTYGTPVPSTGNPAGATISMNPDGSYVFTATTPGVYTYNVPVCVPGGAIPCPAVPLVITVNDPLVDTNPPVVNPDIATTPAGTPVTVPVLVNDGPGNTDGTLGNPAVVTPPAHGTAVVNPDGTITYTPAPGYTGTDTLFYQVCEHPPVANTNCATAPVVITVQPANAVNTTVAADDYAVTTGTTPVTGNVKTNDSDPQGDAQTVAAKSVTLPEGVFVLNADGSYVFTPAAGFAGTVNIPYTTCDNGSPSACAAATLHIVVKAGFPDLTPVIRLTNNVFAAGQTRSFVVDITEILGNAGTSAPIAFNMIVPNGYTLSFNPAQTSTFVAPVTYTVTNPSWNEFVTSPNNKDYQSKSGFTIPKSSKIYIGFSVTRTNALPGASSNISITIYADPTKKYDSNVSNNGYSKLITTN